MLRKHSRPHNNFCTWTLLNIQSLFRFTTIVIEFSNFNRLLTNISSSKLKVDFCFANDSQSDIVVSDDKIITLLTDKS